MKPIEHWMCQACDDLHRSEDAALACHPPWHGWECGHCGDSWDALIEAKKCCLVEDHWCRKRGEWWQTEAAAWKQAAEQLHDRSATAVLVTAADLTRLADRRYAKAEDEHDTDAWDQAIGALLGPAATYDQVHDWVEAHRSKAPPIALLIGALCFLCGVSVGSLARSMRPPRSVGRRYVQPRRDVDRSRQ